MIKATSLCSTYLEENFWLSESTRTTTERSFTNFAMAVGNREINRIEPNDGEKFKGWMLNTGRSKTTANIYLRSIKRVLNWAVMPKKLLKLNPLRLIKQFKVTRKPVLVYEDWQIEQMLRYAPDKRWYAIILTAWQTGLRRGAILNLRAENIRDGFVYVEPKRNTADTWEWEPKDREIRKVPVTDRLAKLFAELGDSYLMLSPKRIARMLELKRDGFLKESHRKCPLQNFRRTFVKIQKQAFGKQIGDFHRLRKTFTTKMCSQLPDYFVMKLTGHSNLKTMTYYLASRESMYEQARLIASGEEKKGFSDKEKPQKSSYHIATLMGDTGLELKFTKQFK